MPKLSTHLPALLIAALLLIAGCQQAPRIAGATKADDDGFVSVFNGKDLTGWTPKIRFEELGSDPKQTFRVVDGTIEVNYSNYDKFGGQFGHLFLNEPYGSYILRLEYRFLGDQQIEGNPGNWAYMNSGVMIHGQAPDTMKKDQDFPDSMEVQLLGQAQDRPEARPTANLCTPGTHYVDMDGKLVRAHCNQSSSQTYRGEQWVKLEIEVHGSKKIIHRVNGQTVFEYVNPQLNDGTLLTKGSISLQSESHPCAFRNIEIKVLDE